MTKSSEKRDLQDYNCLSGSTSNHNNTMTHNAAKMFTLLRVFYSTSNSQYTPVTMGVYDKSSQRGGDTRRRNDTHRTFQKRMKGTEVRCPHHDSHQYESTI